MRAKIRRRCHSLLAVAALGLAFSSDAHREPGSLTTISWNQASGKTEIIHRLHSHDAELGVSEVLNLGNLSVLELEGRANIALYVEERFQIAGNSGAIVMDLVGAELVGDHVLVYQELPGQLPGKIRVLDGILRDIYPTQINQVNITDGEVVHSLAFGDDDGWQEYEFKH